MIGTAACATNTPAKRQQQQQQQKQGSKFAETYRRVVPTVLLLSISSDGVCRKLFHNLLFQIIHWFSGGSSRVHEAETAALVDVLLTGLCDASNSKLRNQCADAVGEFFQWTLKQSSKSELAQHPETLNALLSRLLVLGAHPAEEKRLGAARALGKIYRYHDNRKTWPILAFLMVLTILFDLPSCCIYFPTTLFFPSVYLSSAIAIVVRSFRSETSVVHRYVLRIVYVLLKSLRLGGTEATLQVRMQIIIYYVGTPVRCNEFRE
jgi:hypothetical protein